MLRVEDEQDLFQVCITISGPGTPGSFYCKQMFDGMFVREVLGNKSDAVDGFKEALYRLFTSCQNFRSSTK